MVLTQPTAPLGADLRHVINIHHSTGVNGQFLELIVADEERRLCKKFFFSPPPRHFHTVTH